MWYSISLRSRIYILLIAIVLINLVGGGVMIWYTYKIDGLLTSMIYEDLHAFRTAEALQTSLINQKGFVSYYFLDGDPDWLRQLGEYRQIFRQRLARRQTGGQISGRAGSHRGNGKRVPRVYRAQRPGHRLLSPRPAGDPGANFTSRCGTIFFKTLALCRQYIDLHAERITRASNESHAQARRFRLIALVGMIAGFFLVLMLAFVLAIHILAPVRQLTQEARRIRTPSPGGQ